MATLSGLLKRNGFLSMSYPRTGEEFNRKIRPAFIDAMSFFSRLGMMFATCGFAAVSQLTCIAAPLPVLRRVLADYSDVITGFHNGKADPKAVTAVLTGNYSIPMVAADTNRFAGVDGRVKDIPSTQPGDALLWISDSWQKFFKWRGDG